MSKVSLYLLFLTPAMLMAGCTAGDDANGGSSVDETIHFQTTADAIQTRALTQLINGTDDWLTDGRQFTVCAFSTRDDLGESLLIGSVDGTSVTGIPVTYHQATNSWTTNERYFWPQLSHTVHFYATYPPQPYIKAAEGVTSEYTVQTNNHQEDLLYTYLATNRDEAGKRWGYAAPLAFHHALAQVCFKATTSVSGWQLTVKDITLHNIHNKGHLIFPTAAWQPTDATPTSQSVTFPVTNNQTDAQILLPQHRTAWSPEFYTVAQNDALADTTAIGTYITFKAAIYNTSTSSQELTETDVYCPIAPSWHAGKLYSYTLNFKRPGSGNSAFKADGTSIWPVVTVTVNVTGIENWGTGSSGTTHVK